MKTPTHSTLRVVLATLTILAALALPSHVMATDYTATLSSGTTVFWTNASWSPAGTPGSGDNVDIKATYTSGAVTFRTVGDRTVNNLTLGGAAAANRFSFAGGTTSSSDTMTVSDTLSITNRTVYLHSVDTNYVFTINSTNLVVNTGNTAYSLFLGLNSGRVNLNIAGNTTVTSGGIQIVRGDQIINLGHLDLTSRPLYLSSTNFNETGGTNYTVSVRSLTGVSGSTILNGAPTNTPNVTLEILGENASETSYGGVISDGNGTVSVAKKGSGVQRFAGNNTYTGGTLISGGTLILGNGAGTGAMAGNITNNATLEINRNASTWTNLISGTGKLVTRGQGTSTVITLTGNNTYSGGTEIANGILQLGDGGASGSAGSGTITNNSVLIVKRSDNFTLANDVVGSGRFDKDGAGTLTFTNDYTYTGPTRVLDGALQLGDGGASGSVAGIITNMNATLILNRSDNYTFTNTIAGSSAGNIIKLGAGTTTFAVNNNNYNGTILISAGALNIGGGVSGSSLGSGDITNNSLLIFQRLSGSIVGNAISGSGALVQMGNTVSLTSDNTYSGGTLILSNVLTLGNNGSTGTAGTGAITNNATLQVNRSDTYTLGNLISGSGVLVQRGTGTTILTADNDYSGGTSITNGALQIGNGGTSGSLGSGNITNITHLIVNRSDDVTLSNVISGTGVFEQAGAGTTTLTANNTGNNGTYLISAGALQLGDGTLSGYINAGNITNNSKLIINRTSGNFMTNAISGTGSLEKLGAANQILVGNSTYSGGTLINGGTLTVGTNGTDGTIGSGDITNNAIFQVRRSDAYTLNQTISGTGQFRQDGGGTTTLTGDNTFSAATLVNSGALELNTTGGSALGGTASVSVASGATLLISKSDQVNNSATITLSGGTISRGAGVSEVMGNLDLTAASTINYGAGATGTLTFGTYTPSSLLTVSSFLEGNKLVFGSDLTLSVTNSSYFAFDNGFTSSWNGSTFTITAIPEPSTYAAAAGLLALMLWSLRRRTKRA